MGCRSSDILFCYNGHMKDRNIIFFDLDGTLIADNNRILPGVEELITDLRAHGAICFANSGRGLLNIPESMRNVMDGFITITGASCYYDGELLFTSEIPDDHFNELAEFCFERHIPLFMENNQVMNAIVGEGWLLNEPTINLLPFCTKKYLSFEEYLNDISFTTMKLDTEKVYLPIFEEELKRQEGYITGVESGEWYELLTEGSNKGTAIKKITDYLGIDSKKTYCVGDSDNDLAMFKECNTKIAVQDASDNLKNCADVVLDENTTQGLRKYFTTVGVL